MVKTTKAKDPSRFIVVNGRDPGREGCTGRGLSTGMSPVYGGHPCLSGQRANLHSAERKGLSERSGDYGGKSGYLRSIDRSWNRRRKLLASTETPRHARTLARRSSSSKRSIPTPLATDDRFKASAYYSLEYETAGIVLGSDWRPPMRPAAALEEAISNEARRPALSSTKRLNEDRGVSYRP
ncbi:hypothetical protein KM043_008098 [Ampulex compressa]|nr:hypothetical protein KM043_008098 [Ampulex compressa]